MINKHRQQCNLKEITGFRTSNELALHWKNHFHKNLIYFRIYADFEVDSEIDSSNIGNTTTNFYKQNPAKSSKTKFISEIFLNWI